MTVLGACGFARALGVRPRRSRSEIYFASQRRITDGRIMPETGRRASATLTPAPWPMRTVDDGPDAIFVATFATLGGGKIGAGIIEALCIATIYAGIHAGMQHEYPENGGTCEVNPMWRETRRNWCLAWFARDPRDLGVAAARASSGSFAVPAEFVLSLMHMTSRCSSSRRTAGAATFFGGTSSSTSRSR